MNKTKLYAGLAIGLLIINLVLVAFMLTRSDKLPLEKRDNPREQVIKRLDFSDEQAAEYTARIAEHRERMFAKREQMHELKTSLSQLLKGNDKQAADSVINALSELHKEMEQNFFNHFKDIKKICKPEQLENYNKLVDDMNEIFLRRMPSPDKRGPNRGNRPPRDKRR